jgi:glyoxylase-like metal-dependent hydrolase (beta-lactamase superfamily II)
MIKVQQFSGIEASVNAFTLSSDTHTIAVDLLRNSKEARSFANQIEASGKKLEAIFITHGHPDHYLGLGVFHQQFPKVPIYVATPEIKEDIVGFTGWMESVGWLENEPSMKIKSTVNPNGFDYEGVIQVLSKNSLSLTGSSEKIEIKSDYAGNECAHLATLCIPSQKIFLASDLIYDGVHAWCGSGVDKKAIAEWISIVEQIKQQTTADWTFFAGHGESGGHIKLDTIARYLKKFLSVTAKAPSRTAAISAMVEAYPGFAQSDFLLVHSVAFHVSET